jgi:hypothetical protein
MTDHARPSWIELRRLERTCSGVRAEAGAADGAEGEAGGVPGNAGGGWDADAGPAADAGSAADAPAAGWGAQEAAAHSLGVGGDMGKQGARVAAFRAAAAA